MKCSAFFLLLLFHVFSLAQNKSFEVAGNITGDYNGRVFMFFEDSYKNRDSISSEIRDGKFYFKASAPMPILARFYVGQTSYIQDVYIDNNEVYLQCDNRYTIRKNALGKVDTMNQFSITSVRGSTSEAFKRAVESWLKTLDSSGLPTSQKNLAHYEKLRSLVEKQPGNKVVAYLIGKAANLTYLQVNELSGLLDPTIKETYEGRTVSRLVNSLDKDRNRQNGKAFPTAYLSDTANKKITVQALSHEVTLVEFWASWCGPCRALTPELKSLYNKYKNQGFEIVGVSLDKSKKSWMEAIRKDSLSWPQLIDDQGTLDKYFAIESIPFNILIGANGKIVASDLSPSEIESFILKRNKSYIFLE